VTVADTGSGMSEETLAHAMEPFYTTKGVGKGTGLGLAMVHGFAAQSGGQFVLRTVEGVGTQAQLWLPLAAAGAGAESKRASRSQEPVAAVKRLVIVAVDDDALVLSSTVAMLEEMGHTVFPATSARQALDLLDTDPRVDLVITDQVMPRMTGAELAATLAALRPELPVILATGFSEEPKDPSLRAERLAKPFDQAELTNTIGRAMSKRTSSVDDRAASRA